jgi:hypothetical protein
MEKKHDTQIVVGKLDLFHQPLAAFVFSDGDFCEQHVRDTFSEARLYTPPVPPPRGLLS